MADQNQQTPKTDREKPKIDEFDNAGFQEMIEEKEKEKKLDDLTKGFKETESKTYDVEKQVSTPEKNIDKILEEEREKNKEEQPEQKPDSFSEVASPKGQSGNLSNLTASSNPIVLKLVKKGINGNTKKVINEARKKFKKDPRLLDEFHDALLEAKQLQE